MEKLFAVIAKNAHTLTHDIVFGNRVQQQRHKKTQCYYCCCRFFLFSCNKFRQSAGKVRSGIFGMCMCICAQKQAHGNFIYSLDLSQI